MKPGIDAPLSLRGPATGDPIGAQLPVLSRDAVTRNARAVASFAGTAAAGGDRACFLSALNTLQRFRLPIDLSHDEIVVSFGDEIDVALLSHLMAVEAPPRDRRFTGQEQAGIRQNVSDALALIRRVDPDSWSSLHVVVGALLCARREHFDGGSISSLIGAIWLALEATRPVIDFAEIIVHEYVHQCLFLDDMVNGIFIGGETDLGVDEGLVTSAILRRKRGYDKAFHSAFVAAVLAIFYAACGRADRAAQFLGPVHVTLGELEEKATFLTDHGRDVLGQLAALVRLGATEAHAVPLGGGARG
jgi:HEXXH motif-containing protein